MTAEERAEKIVSHDELLAGLSAAARDFLRDWIAETVELAEAAAEARERERCAKIAEAAHPPQSECPECRRYRRPICESCKSREVAEGIAEAIRASKEQQ